MGNWIKYGAVGLLMMLLASCGSDEDVLLFDQIPLSEIRKEESAVGAKEFDGLAHGVGKVDSLKWENSLMFLRKDADFIPLKTKYYFGQDSTVQYIVYEWNRAVPGTAVEERDQMMAEERGKHEAYHKKFIAIANQIAQKYGNPTDGDGQVKRIPFEQLYMFKADYIWKLEDRSIYHRMVWIPSHGIPVFKVFTKVVFK